MTVEEKKLLSGRLTAKKFVEWCNIQFAKFEIDNWVVTDIERSRFRTQDYEAGATKLYVKFDLKDLSKRDTYTRSSFYCFYSIGELTDYINSGYEIYLKKDSGNSVLTNLEIDVRKRN